MLSLFIASPPMLDVGARRAPAVATYAPRAPSRPVLYRVSAAHLETFLALLDDDPDATGLPAYVRRAFYAYLQCGILAYGLRRLGCDTCKKERLLAVSGKRRGFCPACASRRMAQTAAPLVEPAIPWVPPRQWVGPVPIPWRDWMAASRELPDQSQTISRRTIAPY
jgi:Transposase zinc-binding domain